MRERIVAAIVLKTDGTPPSQQLQHPPDAGRGMRAAMPGAEGHREPSPAPLGVVTQEAAQGEHLGRRPGGQAGVMWFA